MLTSRRISSNTAFAAVGASSMSRSLYTRARSPSDDGDGFPEMVGPARPGAFTVADRVVGMHGVDPVAARRPIDHVVVHQGGGMEHLECRPRVDDSRVRSVAACA